MPMKVYHKLKKQYHGKKWWPMQNDFLPRELEVCVGAILTQNTNWKNVEKALDNMRKAGLTKAEKIIKAKNMEKTIKPAGFYKQKAKYLKNLCGFIVEYGAEKFFKSITREELMKIKGIGKETADSILLYACNKNHFVIDAYTKRIFSRMGIIDENSKYDEIKKFFESSLPRDRGLYKEFHAMIVEHAKNVCKKEPLCEKCIFKCKKQ